MQDWPEGWYRDERPRRRDEADAVTARYPRRAGRDPVAGYEPDAVTARYPAGARPRRRRLRPRRVLQGVAVLVIVILVAAGGFYLYLNSKLTRVDALPAYPGRPSPGAGQNWLLTGSDSRQGLTGGQENQLSLGRDISGGRSDTIMILHIPSGGGRPVLVSLPRDSYVPIPGHGYNKINAAYAIGGPQLLAQTVQDVTGLDINHYMGIGLGGLVTVVNDVGGVTMCLPTPLRDKASGLNLKAGCQTLDGGQALSFVRDRHSFATEDLQRIQDQRALLKALLVKATSPETLLNPFATVPAIDGAVRTLTVDQGTQLYQLAAAAFALRDPLTTTVPIANPNYPTPAGDAVLWNRTEALQLFDDLRTDTQPPADLITGSRVG